MKERLSLQSVLAGLMGFATADALGVPIEFTSRESHLDSPLTEMKGYGSHKVPEGTWSDDTSMTIAAMDSISQLGGRMEYENIMRAFSAWEEDAMYTATDEVFDMGIATAGAIRRFREGDTPAVLCGGDGPYDNGNGSLMRMLPAVYYLYQKQPEREDEVNTVRDFSSLTHRHEISLLGCLIYFDYMKMLLDGMSPEEAYGKLKTNDYSAFFKKETVSRYERILDGKLKELEVNDISSSGFIVHTLEAAIWCVLNTGSYEEAAVKAVNLGDDTDTVGAVTGSIAATVYGLNSIPERWLEKLKKKEYLTGIATKFHSKITAEGNVPLPRFTDEF